MERINYILRQRGSRPEADLSCMGREEMERARAFHRSIPDYRPTPLVRLSGLAEELGIRALWVKDESSRFGLNAFKGLGGSYAVARCLAERLDLPVKDLTFQAVGNLEIKEKLGTLTFVTATDGNHGRGVAWAARVLGHKAVVYMPKGSAPERLANIRAQGAQAEITPYNYDGAVRFAARMAEEKDWILVQDTAWPGYETIPTWIMQGYTTLAGEILDQLGDEVPTHLFLQAGVGSFAGAVLGVFADRWGERRPITCVVEPDKADCHFRTARADDGTLHTVTGDMDSMMAGLCCGEPCTLSWTILDACADGFLSCNDECSALGMRLLGRPAGSDPAVVSGESGAVGAGVLAAIRRQEELASLREALKLDKTASVLLISTEGDTDRENYQKILRG